jgi:uncharacterized damage-inducible protein DinB
MARTSLVPTLLMLSVAFAPAARAADPATAAAPAAPVRVQDEAIKNFADAGDKLVRLAEAIPAGTYTWRPVEGVRSVSEALLHVATGNYGIPRRFGTAPPEGIDLRGLEKSTTDKARVVELLRGSVEHARKAMAAVPDANLEQTLEWFDKSRISQRGVMFFLASHNHEHLGQLIAYARSNGVTPPWSVKE